MRRGTTRSDAGFTLIEVVSAGVVVAIVMAASTTFFIKAMTTINLQGARQAAVQLAMDAMEQLRAVPGSNALSWLTANASMPDQTRNGLTYKTAWTCVDADSPAKLAAVTKCAPGTLMLEPTVTVTFQGNGCPTAGCTYTTKTRISTYSVDPIFQGTL